MRKRLLVRVLPLLMITGMSVWAVGAALAADQTRTRDQGTSCVADCDGPTRDQDQDQTRDRLNDGTVAATTDSVLASSGAVSSVTVTSGDRLRDGDGGDCYADCDGNPDQLRLRDGSCQDTETTVSVMSTRAGSRTPTTGNPTQTQEQKRSQAQAETGEQVQPQARTQEQAGPQAQAQERMRTQVETQTPTRAENEVQAQVETRTQEQNQVQTQHQVQPQAGPTIDPASPLGTGDAPGTGPGGPGGH